MQRLDEHVPHEPSTNGHPEQHAGSDLLDLWRHIYGEQQGLIGLFSGHRKPSAKRLTDRHEQYFSWPDQQAQAAAWLVAESDQGREAYHCAHLLTAERRIKEHAAPVGALWTDDDGVPPLDKVPPTAQVETSPGRMQSYYRLTCPIDPKRAEQLNRRLTYEMHADKGGWHLGKPLRSPGTRNHKYPDAPTVDLFYIDLDMAYDPDQLDHLLPPLPAESIHKVPGSPLQPVDLPADLPPVDIEQLAVPSEIKALIRQGKPQGKRSEAVAAVACALLRAGCDHAHVAAVLLDPANGISDKPREKGRSWLAAEITRHQRFIEEHDPPDQLRVVREAETILREPPAPPAGSPFRTLGDMRAEQGGSAQESWILEGYIARGAITLLVGDSKGGKSTWLTGLLKALESGAAFCGLATQKTDVVYLIEEDKTTLDHRCRAVGLDTDHVAWLTADAGPLLPDWQARVTAAISEAERRGAHLILIDTFAHWADLDPGQEWDDAVVTGRLSSFGTRPPKV